MACPDPLKLGAAIHAEVALLQMQEGDGAAVERLTAIVAALADVLLWDQQRRFGPAIGYVLMVEPHPGPIRSDKVLP